MTNLWVLNMSDKGKSKLFKKRYEAPILGKADYTKIKDYVPEKGSILGTYKDNSITGIERDEDETEDIEI